MKQKPFLTYYNIEVYELRTIEEVLNRFYDDSTNHHAQAFADELNQAQLVTRNRGGTKYNHYVQAYKAQNGYYYIRESTSSSSNWIDKVNQKIVALEAYHLIKNASVNQNNQKEYDKRIKELLKIINS